MKKREDLWGKALSLGYITKRQKEQLECWLGQFYSEIKQSHVVLMYNGFFACGRLKNKVKHHPDKEPCNDVLIVHTTSSDRHRSLQCNPVYLTEEEARDLGKCIRIGLKKRNNK